MRYAISSHSDSPAEKTNPPSQSLKRPERLKNAIIGECSFDIISKSICLRAVFTAGEQVFVNVVSSLSHKLLVFSAASKPSAIS